MRLFLFIIFILFSSGLLAETGIIPYKAAESSSYFPESSGLEYAKLLRLSAIVKKGAQIIPVSEMQRHLKRPASFYAGTLNGDNLRSIAEAAGLDYVISGTVSRRDKKFFSRSVLFSAKEGRVIYRNDSSAFSLEELASREALVLFVDHKDKNPETEKRRVALACVIDSSWGMKDYWHGIKEALIAQSSRIMEGAGTGLTVYLISFNDTMEKPQVIKTAGSIQEHKKALDKIKFTGISSTDSFLPALKLSLEELGRADNAEKHIVILNNSNLSRGSYFAQYGIMASEKKITVSSVSAGGASSSFSLIPDRLAEMTKGLRASLTYHNRVWAADGREINLYVENRRLFKSSFYEPSWKEGLFSGNPYDRNAGMPRAFLDEIRFDNEQFDLNPQNTVKLFPSLTGIRVIRNGNLSCNSAEVLARLPVLKEPGFSAEPFGSLHITDGAVSFWVKMNEREKYEFFDTEEKKKFSFYTVISFIEDASSPYGIIPLLHAIDISPDEVPDSLRVQFNEVIKDSASYVRRGRFFAAYIKVLRSQAANSEKDIRE